MELLSACPMSDPANTRDTVNMVIMAQKKVRSVRDVDQKDACSSNVKSTPPIGARKAAAMPAAAP